MVGAYAFSNIIYCFLPVNLSADAIAELATDGNTLIKDDIAPSTLHETSKQSEDILNQETIETCEMSTEHGNLQKKEEGPSGSGLQQTRDQHAPTPSTSFDPGQSHQNEPPTEGARTCVETRNTIVLPSIMRNPIQTIWSDQIRDIIKNHNEGNRIFIIMRGVPGSGKTYLSKQLVDMLLGAELINYATHIFSADDFFIVRGIYRYNKYKITEAHVWNKNKVHVAAFHGVSPIIVDNTNIELWEMEVYAKEAVSNGYIIYVVEPTTPWAKNAVDLAQKNVHGVSIGTIQRMLENYRCNVTGTSLMQYYSLSYPPGMAPPVKRNEPPLTEEVTEALPKSSFEKDLSSLVTKTLLSKFKPV